MNIFGDISGYYKTFLLLLKKMPDEEPISLGDMNDRGPASKEVFDFFMNNGQVILGNHEHMMLDYLNGEKYYEDGLWFDAWGKETLKSFKNDEELDFLDMENYRFWLEKLPYFLEFDDLILTHGPIHPEYKLNQAIKIGENYLSDESDFSVLWNRVVPNRPRDKFMAFGHNTSKNVKWYKNKEKPYAVCLDTSGYGCLTGMHWPTMEIFQQKIID